jgi:putative PIN family toxin of toxin-antitoxin system
MFKIVIDTNVIIAAVHNPAGKPALVLSVTLSEMPELIAMYISPEIWGEYQEVLAREKFDYFNKSHVKALLSQIKKHAIIVEPSLAVSAIKIDPADNRFLECALAAEADYLITGNTKHFPFKRFQHT